MNLTLKYDCEITEYMVIPEGTEVKLYGDWNEYDGFTAIEYQGEVYYLNDQYFVEVPVAALW